MSIFNIYSLIFKKYILLAFNFSSLINLLQGLQVQEKHQHAINLHRDIALSMSHVGIQLDQLSNARLVEDLPLFQALSAHNDSISIGDPEVLGRMFPYKLIYRIMCAYLF